jgi:hypothetical protein
VAAAIVNIHLRNRVKVELFYHWRFPINDVNFTERKLFLVRLQFGRRCAQ